MHHVLEVLRHHLLTCEATIAEIGLARGFREAKAWLITVTEFYIKIQKTTTQTRVKIKLGSKHGDKCQPAA